MVDIQNNNPETQLQLIQPPNIFDISPAINTAIMGAHTIFVRNMSGKPQEFEVHGWNNNKNITVGAHSETKISAPDGSSGAIIALHDGHEGEQAEITKDGQHKHTPKRHVSRT